MNVSRERERVERERVRRGEELETRNFRAEDRPTFLGHSTLRRAIFNEQPPTFGYYYSSTLETSKRVGGAQIRRLITNESERGEACPNRIALLLPPSIIRGINLRKLGEIGEEKLAVRERERFEGREEEKL